MKKETLASGSWSSTVTTKGQVTLPVEIRRRLGIAPRDRVTFVLEDDQVRIFPSGGVVSRTAGILRGPHRPATTESLREEIEQAISDETVARTAR